MIRHLPSILLLVSLAAACQQQIATQTINGIPPYTLGASQEAILKANPALESGSGSFFGELELTYQGISGILASRGHVVSTTDYKGVLRSGAESLTQDAALSLQFYKGKLAAVILFWANVPHLTPQVPREVQISTEDASALYRRLRQKYGPPVRDTLKPTGGTQGQMIIRDRLGNLLIMGGRNPGVGVGLGYIWAPFVKAVGEPP